jgi:hypothetical protein
MQEKLARWQAVRCKPWEFFSKTFTLQGFRQRKNIDLLAESSLKFVVMKWFFLPPLVFIAGSLTSCGSFNQPLSGDFDPLTAPGATNKVAANASINSFQPGQYVTAASNSTAFFSNRPSGNAEAEQLLAAGTSMRVVKTDGSFVKVELDNGQVGYVSSVMVTDGKSAGGLPPGAVQVYPPVGGDSPLPLPADLQPAASPLPPTDLNNGTPPPPIEPPSIPELPPAAPKDLPAPAAEAGHPAPPIEAPKKPAE